MIRNGLAPALLLTLACGGIGEPPPTPDVAAAYASFGCPDAAAGACSLVSAFDNGSLPELGPTGVTSGTGYETWVGPSYATDTEQRYMSAPRKWYIEANIPYMGFREVWPDDASEREELETVIEDSKAGRAPDELNKAGIFLHRLADTTPDYLRLVQKTQRSIYLKPPNHGSCGDSCSPLIQAWVRQDGERMILLESGPDGHRVSALYRVRFPKE